VHAEVAEDYFQIRGLDAQDRLVAIELAAAEESLGLTQVQANHGLASGQDVDQAMGLLGLVQAQLTDIDIQRALLEHAVAALVGKPSGSFTLAHVAGDLTPVSVPAGLPSQLLERRPDVAAAERRVAAANAQIGVARAAYFPALGLNASAGFASSTLGDLLSAPAFVWSVGASLSQTLFDGGKRAGVTSQAWAAYQGTVANYRQTVLRAFQSVEDSLSTSRILVIELDQQNSVVGASRDFLALAQNGYDAGIEPYGDVLTAQTAMLNNQKAALSIQTAQMTASVQLINALGGGWDARQDQPK
jgi:NodT family efflux transporter outer membrane factor (OMF) lipoprotein